MFRSLARGVIFSLALLPAFAAAASAPGVNKGYMDTTCSPCKDFFRYAVGAWADTASIPAAYTGVGAGREMGDRNQAVLYRVLEAQRAKAATEKDPTLKKVGDFYSVLMDSTRTNAEGITPIAADLAAIDKIDSKGDLIEQMGRFSKFGLSVPFRWGAEADAENSAMNIATIGQGGLGLPERDYYFRTDPKSDSTRQFYVATMVKMFTLAGISPGDAAEQAKAVMALETALAESSMTRVAMRDPHATVHKMTEKDMAVLTPAFNFTTYFTEAGIPSIAASSTTWNVGMPAFMRGFNAVFDNTPVDTWKAYLRWHLLRNAAPWLSQEFFDTSFALQSKFSGAKVPLPRWKRASATMDGTMGEAIGKAYVASEFPPSSKARMVELVNNLQATYRERILQLDWMSDATKKQAVVKLDAILKKVGYPDKWRDYTALRIDPKLSALANLRQASTFYNNIELAKIGKPVDRTEWGMTPPTVNAYYNPSVNEIVFPAGILSPPQFDPRVDDAVNYGAIGMVIGHEITHGFDDQGRQFDSVGNLHDWWTDSDATKFKEKAQRVIDQFDSYVAVDTLHLNGQLTLGENIADLGGLTIAYYAWKRSLHGKPAPTIDGFTGEQRFFLGHAQAWRRKNRPESMRTAVLTDPHSSAQWRVNGPDSNMREFMQAFHCKAGDPMVRPDNVRAQIW